MVYKHLVLLYILEYRTICVLLVKKIAYASIHY